MLPPDSARQTLLALFRHQPTVELETLLNTLQTRSPMSVFRRLREIQYLSSFSHAGRFYTLAHIPTFDSFGLWFHQGIGFSKLGTLKATVRELVCSSPMGLFHHELEAILHLPVHNTLLELVRSSLLTREPVSHAGLLYLSPDERRATEQRHRRSTPEPPLLSTHPPLPAQLVIEILVETILAARTTTLPTSEQLSVRLGLRGINVTNDDIQRVFQQYGLEKKTLKSPSRRSRR